MPLKKNNVIAVAVGIVVLVVVVFVGLTVTQNMGKSSQEVNAEQAIKNVSEMAQRVNAKTGKPVKSAVVYDDAEVTAAELPDINTREVVTKATTDTSIEIFAVSNVAGTDSDAWLADMAKQFNASGATVDGKPVSVSVRKVASGEIVDYIVSGAATPDAVCISNDLWLEIMKARGVPVNIVRESMVRDVAGILLDQEHYDAIIAEYGAVDMRSITESVAKGDLAFGYTNPFTSSTGMNFLASTLVRYDPANPLSDTAAKGFQSFQANVPLVSTTTQQMVNASRNGTLNGFVNEYQVYSKDDALKANYTFTPFGYRHDYPFATVTNDETANQIAELFAQYCDANGAELAAKDGFNGMDSYVCEQAPMDGNTLIAAESFYKQNKDSRPVVCVFVADTSGSMSGASLTALKNSLVNGMKYINEDNYVGLVSYNSDVTIELPIAKFDRINQQPLFKGAVENLNAVGQTATYDAIAVAADMVNKQLEATPDAKPMIFVLSDGQENGSMYKLSDITPVLRGLGYPVYTIGYNANIDALKQIADINEAASIDANTDDVAYQLKTLFNANM